MDADRPHVIVVNDDVVQLGLTARLIESEGIEVHAFSSAQDALEYVSRVPNVDLVVTDLRMPGIDGWRFCRLLRSPDFPQTNKTPILAVSATFAGQDIGPSIRESNIDAFLGVPYRVEELRAAIHDLLHRQTPIEPPLVLIVDQDTARRRAMEEAFAARGYAVAAANDEAQARVLYRDRRPDVIVLVHAPPRIDASNLLPSFKHGGNGSIVATITDEHSPELAIAFALLGADICLHHPLENARLIELTERARREKVMLHVEGTFDAWAQEALANTRRVRQLNECFLSLGPDHSENIEKLAQAAGDMLGAVCTSYRGMYYPRSETHARAEQDDDVPPTGKATPRVVRNVQDTEYANADPRIRALGVRTLIECPVTVKGLDVGTLCLGWTDDREPEDEEIDLLNVLARAISLQEQMKQREQELIALNEIGRVVSSALNLAEMLRLLRGEARDVLDAQACSIALVDPQTGELVFEQADDPLADQVVGQRLQPGQGIAGQVAQAGRSALIHDARSDPRFYDGIDAVTGFSTREIICAPLIAEGRTIGVIEVLNKRHGRFTEEDVRLLESVAAQTASAVENARLHEATQRELRDRVQAERRLQTLIDAAPDLIYLKDRALTYLLVNQAFAAFWGLEPGEIVGHTDFDFMPPGTATANHLSDRWTLAKRQVIIEERQEGERVIETRKVAVLDDKGQATGVVGIIRDITDRKRLEEQLLLEQKEESVLTLAAGIAHDFNNALVGIVGNVGLLRSDLPPNHNAQRSFRAMERSAQRMVNLTEQLLAYAGSVRHERQMVDVNAVIAETWEMLRGGAEATVTVQLDLDDGLWLVRANASQVRQVLINLITNAREAVADAGGTLTIGTRNVRREAWVCARHRQHPAGEYVHLFVQDTGPGIEPQVAERLFEPFFTTKFMGRGLGLAVASTIVRDHAGCIAIQSEPGRGTTVRVYLPRPGPEADHEPVTE